MLGYDLDTKTITDIDLLHLSEEEEQMEWSGGTLGYRVAIGPKTSTSKPSK